LVLRHAGLEQLGDAGQTGRDLTAGDVHTTGVERTHRQLRARLTDRLRRDDADGLAQAHAAAVSRAHAVAHGADTAAGATGQRRAHVDAFVTGSQEGVGNLRRDLLVALHDDLARLRVSHRRRGVAADDPLSQGLQHRLVLGLGEPDAGERAAVLL